jgi:hypothetical protein
MIYIDQTRKPIEKTLTPLTVEEGGLRKGGTINV